jgi:hypothetical protein
MNGDKTDDNVDDTTTVAICNRNATAVKLIQNSSINNILSYLNIVKVGKNLAR